MKSNMTQRERDRLVQEIKLFIEYGVTEEQQDHAVEVLESYNDNTIALITMRDFYSRLPEFREEGVHEVFKIISRMGCILLGVKTKGYEYLYFFDGEHPFYLGEKKDGIQDDEVLTFLGYSSNEELKKELQMQEGVNGEVVPKTFCPACSVESGSLHHLGCPVELCPWCEGQFNYCNCRFEKLGVDEIVDESELDRLEILLNDKGRIPFTPDHAPSYPRAGTDSDEE